MWEEVALILIPQLLQRWRLRRIEIFMHSERSVPSTLLSFFLGYHENHGSGSVSCKPIVVAEGSITCLESPTAGKQLSASGKFSGVGKLN